ncbi:MAG: hypothetical protein LHV68_08105 [Elusimicrobia bacterium]|nr:hypothetical protein [Candidatus Liberimonas magnetica]
MATRIREIIAQAIKIYSHEVEVIIVSRSTDENRIQNILDGMLDFCYDENMLELYKKLCRYYYKINPSVTVI